MKYDEVSAQAGSSKKKGAAESDYLSEAGDVAAETAQKNEGAPPRKKGSAKKDPKKIATKIAKGKAKAEAKKGAVKKDVMMDEKPVARKKGAAEYGGKKGDDSKSKKDYEGSGKKKGAAEYSVKIGAHPDSPKHGSHEGGGRKAGAAMGFTQNFGPARQNSYARGAAKVAQIMGKGAFKKKGAADHEAGKPSHPKPNLSLNTSIKPSSSMPDYSSSSSINQEVPKAPNLTANSYKGHSSVKDVVNTQSSNRDYSSPSAMNLKDNNISRNSQFHYDTKNTGKLTPELNASYDKFLGKSSYMSSRDMQKNNKNVNLNNPISKSNKNAQTAFKEGRVYNNKYGF